MTIVLLLVSFLVIIKDWRSLIGVLLSASMWINPDVRCGSASFMFYLMAFIVVYSLLRKDLVVRYAGGAKKKFTKLLLYLAFVNVPFLLFSTGEFGRDFAVIKIQLVALMTCFFLFSFKYDSSAERKSSLFLFFSITTISLYGIYTYITKTNPFIEAISPYMTMTDRLENAIRSINNARGILSGRITGTSLYTIQYAIMMAMIMFVTYYPFGKRFPKGLLFILLGLLFVNLYLTGSRGPFLALVLSVSFYFSKSLPLKKQVFYILGVFFLCTIFYSYIDYFIGSFFSSDIEGSTVQGRSVQLYGAYTLVAGDWQSLLFGRGFSFVSHYISTKGAHPLALCFESTHVSGLVNYGVLGLIFCFVGKLFAMAFLAYDYYKHSLIEKKSYYWILSFLLMNFFCNILVGDVYGNLFMFIYVIMLKSALNNGTKNCVS